MFSGNGFSSQEGYPALKCIYILSYIQSHSLMIIASLNPILTNHHRLSSRVRYFIRCKPNHNCSLPNCSSRKLVSIICIEPRLSYLLWAINKRLGCENYLWLVYWREINPKRYKLPLRKIEVEKMNLMYHWQTQVKIEKPNWRRNNCWIYYYVEMRRY